MKGDAGKKGFALTEILIVIGIIGFALVSLLALITMGIETNRVSAEESGAISLASAILSDLRNSPETDSRGTPLTTTTRFKFPLPSSVSEKTTEGPVQLDLDGNVVMADSEASYWVELRYTPSGLHRESPAIPDRSPAYVVLKITWPAHGATQSSVIKGQWECVTAFPQLGAAWK